MNLLLCLFLLALVLRFLDSLANRSPYLAFNSFTAKAALGSQVVEVGVLLHVIQGGQLFLAEQGFL